ncbi:calcium-translocating P-type ATPase, SERCA-type [Syntrophomonas curvata]
MINPLWYQKSQAEILEQLNTSAENGLNSKTVQQRSGEPPNVIEEGPGTSPLSIFFKQFTDTMVIVLLGATVVSGIIGAMADAITIMAIVILNAVLGFIQEYRAERSLEEIKKLASPFARVLRNGKKLSIPTRELLTGDIVLIEAGDRIPADLRLLESSSLEIDEASLTGESVPITKDPWAALSGETPLAEVANMAFMGTGVTRGRGKAVVVATGMDTVMGEIARMMKNEKEDLTPLQVKLGQLGKYLVIVCLLVCTLVTLMGIYRGEQVLTMFLAGISLAVAAIPEGLPAIVTIVLALGVQRMAQRNAIIRRLPAVETLGCTTVICSDKTGTLTQNKMTVKKMATLDHTIMVEGEGYNPTGRFILGKKDIDPGEDKAAGILLEVAANCNNSSLEKQKGGYRISGDPTEGALRVLAAKAGFNPEYARLHEIPFDSERKLMSVVIDRHGEPVLLVKGALEVIIARCTSVMEGGKVTVFTSRHRNYLNQLQEEWANQALRVLGFACKKLSSSELAAPDEGKWENKLVLVGICGMIDPPRTGVKDSVRVSRQAGIVPLMITGDHPVTARAIAAEIGIAPEEQVIAGPEIDQMSDEELYRGAIKKRVFARVSPQHKNRIVKVLKKHGHVVAMTGDGVNDAPALKAADIGVAMGITGTEVSREASAMILADDNFSTIVNAVYEGRAIYDNIRKFIRYLLGCNIGEVLVMFTASLLGMPLPLLPIQILWINLVTDGLPAMALGLEPPEPGIMQRKPRPRDEDIFARGLGRIILGRGIYIAFVALLAFAVGMTVSRMNGVQDLGMARTMALTTLVLAQLFYVFECRSERFSPFELGFFTNRFLVGAVLCSVFMQVLTIYWPVLQNIFKTVPLDGWQWLLILFISGFRLLGKFILYTWQRLFLSGFEYGKINA